MQVSMKRLSFLCTCAIHYFSSPSILYPLHIHPQVLSCDPLRVFIFHEGLARICTEKYVAPKASNLSISYMHLTNYAVNKHNENFIANQNTSEESAEDASKWSLQQLAEYINGQGKDWNAVWESMQQLIVKSLMSVQPVLRNNYRSVLPPDNDGFSCFEILG